MDTTFASPDQPYGKFNTEEALRSAFMKTPVVSITRGDLTYDPRHRMDGLYYPIEVARGGEVSIVSLYPRPYRIPYQLDLRTRTRRWANLWLQWIYFNFNPIRILKIDFGYPWGVKKCDLELVSRVVDNSDLEPLGKERWIRHSVTLEMLAFMYPSVDDLMNDVPDSFGQLRRGKDVRHVYVDLYSSSTPSEGINDPTSVHLETVERHVLEPPVSLPVESL